MLYTFIILINKHNWLKEKYNLEEYTEITNTYFYKLYYNIFYYNTWNI